ncbi:molybdopterin-binding protein [Solicola gregarius]|uniref:DUF11 domain-containing protein n=1 Tax=Solicola gregarius TaxID=2908642 RepID=A0AA46TFY5_9ACTN|nr:hypothetical protein [Solicola gregarius]UYM04525.1 hypothetical protein L0C25_18610 [Solicola gregarius]
MHTPRGRRSPHRRWRRVVTVGAAAIATTAPIIAGPAQASPPSGAPAGRPAERDQVVTLVTGDRVRVTDRGRGQRSYDLLPGSPSYGERPMIFGSADSMYVIPRMDDEARARLDFSMFDVTALAKERGDSVPLTVRFERGARAHDVPGLDVDPSGVRRTSGNALVADATYVPAEAGSDPAEWAGVASVRLANAPERTTTGDRAKKKTLTVRLKGRNGKPVRRAEAWVQRVDRGKAYSNPVAIKNGVARVRLPKGSYSVFAFRGRYLVGRPDLPVRKNRGLRLNLSDAKVRPSVSVRGARAVGGGMVLKLARLSAKGHEFAVLGDATSRLQPMPKDPEHGRFGTEVIGYFTRKPKAQHPNVFTTDVADGIPRDLSFRHDRSDFAKVPVRVHSDGAPHDFARARAARPMARYDAGGWVPRLMGGLSVGSGWSSPIDTPEQRRVWLQASPDVVWRQGVVMYRGDEEVDVSVAKRYAAGLAKPVHFLRGPTGPGIERGLNGAGTGPACALCRDGNILRGYLPLASSAGTGQDGYSDSRRTGSWTLRDSRKVRDRGQWDISPRVVLPAKNKHYTLRATSRLSPLGWRLSTRVSTSWGFTSGKGKRVVPLLMPSYVPPTDLVGRAEPGEVTYRLDVGNLGPVDARVEEASVRYSTNGGKSWRRAELDRVDDSAFRVSYRNPAASGKPKYVSLQVRATDAGGRTVKETAIRAYRVRGANG